MNKHRSRSTNNWLPCRQILAAVSVPLVMTASGVAGGAGTDGPGQGAAFGANPGTQDLHRGAADPRVYSVINLAPDNLGAFLNERGQAAFSSFIYYNSSYFDGERIHGIAPLGATLVQGLSDRGTVTGISEDNAEPISNVRAFSWTVAGGLRLLPRIDASAFAINGRNQIVGRANEMGTTGRAVRWDPDGRVLPLGPRPPEQSLARSINDRSIAGGFADLADGRVQAVLWDPLGRQFDLGNLGREYASADYVNERGEAAGQLFGSETDPAGTFFWSARSGMVALPAQGTRGVYPSDLNDRGNLAGVVLARDQPAADRSAFRWSLAGGLAWLPPAPGPGILTDVTDINNRNQMVGSVDRAGGGERAVRWDWNGMPIDLNSRLYRAPPGLVLSSGRAINEAGTILADSSAGLVMLRPGTRGTDAPVLGPVTGLPYRIAPGQEVQGSVGFVDNAPRQTHGATVTWSDGCPSPHALVREANGSGVASFRHRACKPGMFDVRVRILDSGGRSTETATLYIVEEPGMPAVSGQGALAQAGTTADTPPLRFALWAPLAGGRTASTQAAAAGSTLRLAGPLQFRSECIDVAAREGALVRMEGSGRFNGRSGHHFLAEARLRPHGDAAGRDRLRIRISHTAPDGTEVVDYDNALPASERTTVMQGALATSE